MEKPEYIYINVTFQDLTWEKQQEIINSVEEAIQNDPELMITDHEGELNVEETDEHVENVATRLAEKSWLEWGVNINGR
jgi:hypothetical protein